jgi:hypothetical protein
MSTTKKALFALALSSMLMPAAASAADEQPACYMHAKLSTTRMLRRTALALTGRVPSMDEYAAVDGLGSDDPAVEAIIDGWLASDEYRVQMRRYHMGLLWSNPAGVSLRDVGMTLNRLNLGTGQAPNYVWRVTSTGRRLLYRGGDGTHSCQDKNQATLGYDGSGLPNCEAKGSDGAGPYCQEGWVMVTPFYDPSTQIKVCAFDAQDNDTWDKVTTPNPGTYSCGDVQARNVKECGCGPNLRFCLFGSPVNLDAMITDAMQEQLLLLVDDHTRAGASYRDMLTTDAAYSNGVLDFYMSYQAANAAFSKVYDAPHTGDWQLDPDWQATDFRAVQRSGVHAGILTLPAYTLRFQTNRGRANRFRIAFLGQYFVPPSSDPTPGCSPDAADLTQRCVCLGCHQTLEPLAAYFGQVTEAGSGLMSDFLEQVATAQACRDQNPPGQTAFCTRFYNQITVDDPDNPGDTMQVWRIKPLEFADTHPEYEANYDAGPAGLVDDEALTKLQGKEYGYLAWATVRNVFSFLMMRELDLDPLSEDNEQALLDELAIEFEANDFDFQALVKRIVMLPEFRRMP